MDGLEPKLKEALKLDPNSFSANYRLGEFYLHAGKLQEGIPYMEKAQSLEPSDYVSGYDLALAYFETQQYAKARRQIQAMLRKTNSAELHSLLADVDESAGDYLAAASEYQNAAQMEPSNDNIFNWGTELLVHQTFDAAIEVFTRGVSLYPRSVKLNVGLGVAFYLRGDYPHAVKALCSATDLEPSLAWPYLFLGRSYNNVSGTDAEEVRKRLQRFAQLEPRSAQALYYYAMSLWERGRESQPSLPQVESLLKRALAVDPKFVDAHVQLGILYADQHRYPEAIGEFRCAIALQPALTTAHYHLAQAYIRTGERSQARSELQTFEHLRTQDQAETEKERNEVKQFIVSMKAK
jgi:tetratricopeptide (TPR) repeat protein